MENVINFNCRGSKALGLAETEIRNRIPNPDITRAEITHQALMLADSDCPLTKDKILEITKKIKSLKNHSTNDTTYATGLAIKITKSDYEIMENTMNTIVEALGLERPRSQFLLEVIWWNLMEHLQQQEEPIDNHSEQEAFVEDNAEVELALIEDLLQIIKANRGNKTVMTKIRGFFDDIKKETGYEKSIGKIAKN